MSLRDVSPILQEFPFRLGNHVNDQKLTFKKCWFGVESPALEILLLALEAVDAFQRHLPGSLSIFSQGDGKCRFAYFMHPFEHSICAQ